MDESNYTERYNQFSIDANIEFLNAPIGQYNYKVYQQTSAINIDESSTGPVLEYGKLLIMRAVDFTFKKYNQPQSFKAYNG